MHLNFIDAISLTGLTAATFHIEGESIGYKVVMWDVVTRDYSRFKSPEQVLQNVKKYTRDGSILVFHDSLKAEKKMKYALPLAIEWLLAQGYSFELIP